MFCWRVQTPWLLSPSLSYSHQSPDHVLHAIGFFDSSGFFVVGCIFSHAWSRTFFFLSASRCCHIPPRHLIGAVRLLRTSVADLVLLRRLFGSSMQRAEPKFCGAYQARRIVKGRPACPYTRRECPFGQHACERCGQSGHGGEDCRNLPPEPVTVPPPAAAPVSPTPPLLPPPPQLLPRTPSSEFLALACTSKAGALLWPGRESAPAPTLPAAPLAPTSAPAPSEPPPPKAVYVTGFGCKGEGKGANYGISIPPPSLVFGWEVPQWSGGASSHEGAAKQEPGAERPESACPDPIAASPAEVERWIAGCFRPLTNISTKMPPEIGESVLWRGVKTGAAGNPSTVAEWFNGKVRYIAFDAAGEMWVYVD